MAVGSARLPGFLNRPTRHLFFTGKGGVGKTSLSNAKRVVGMSRRVAGAMPTAAAGSVTA